SQLARATFQNWRPHSPPSSPVSQERRPAMGKEKPWNRCDECGRFIAHEDFGRGARRTMTLPDSDYSFEAWKNTCVACVQNETAITEMMIPPARCSSWPEGYEGGQCPDMAT